MSQLWHNFAKTVRKLLKRWRGACKPDSVRCTTLQQCRATIIPLGRTSRCGSSNLPEGSPPSRLAPIRRELLFSSSAGRASPPLLFGLAPRGVCHAGDITVAAVGSYPTFSPLPAREPCRHPEGFPSVCHRVALRRRYLLCGTFRDAAACAASSPGVTRRVALLRLREVVSGLSSRPGLVWAALAASLHRGQRSSDSPATPIVPWSRTQEMLFLPPLITAGTSPMRPRSQVWDGQKPPAGGRRFQSQGWPTV